MTGLVRYLIRFLAIYSFHTARASHLRRKVLENSWSGSCNWYFHNASQYSYDNSSRTWWKRLLSEFGVTGELWYFLDGFGKGYCCCNNTSLNTYIVSMVEERRTFLNTTLHAGKWLTKNDIQWNKYTGR